jgi:hypothetical protein
MVSVQTQLNPHPGRIVSDAAVPHCWAKTGMNSADAAIQARQAFNQIFDKPYEWFDA